MRDDRKRQLLALCAMLLVPLCALADGQPPTRATVEERLQAAKLTELALLARNAGADEWRKLQLVYASLAAEYPRNAAVRNAFGELLWNRSERGRAMKEWEAAEKIDPKNAVILDHLAAGWLDAGDAKKAAAFAARAVACEPSNAAYHFSLANVTFLFRHALTGPDLPDSDAVLKRAIGHFAEASRLQPENGEYARAYAETFYSISNPDWPAALVAWQRFLKSTSQKDFAFANLARVHLKLGQMQEAADCLNSIQGAGFERLKKAFREKIGSSATKVSEKAPSP